MNGFAEAMERTENTVMKPKSGIRAALRRGMLLSLSAAAIALSVPAAAQVRAAPLTLLVPFSAGGPSDQLARALGQKMTALAGYPVIVENKPGGGGQIAAAALKSAPADGRTMLIGDIGVLAVNKSLYRNLSFDTLKDFAPVSLVGKSPMLLLVPRDLPVKTAKDLVDHARSTPDGIFYASQGVGIGGHLLGEMFRQQTGANFSHVPYKGAAPAVQDLLAGRVGFLFEVPAVTLQYVKEGRLKALAVASDKRTPLLPGVPTMSEAGVPSVSMDIWWAIVARAGTPPAEIVAMNKLLRTALASDDLKTKFASLGVNLQSSTPEELHALFVMEINRLGKVVRESGATVD